MKRKLAPIKFSEQVQSLLAHAFVQWTKGHLSPGNKRVIPIFDHDTCLLASLMESFWIFLPRPSCTVVVTALGVEPYGNMARHAAQHRFFCPCSTFSDASECTDRHSITAQVRDKFDMLLPIHLPQLFALDGPIKAAPLPDIENPWQGVFRIGG